MPSTDINGSPIVILSKEEAILVLKMTRTLNEIDGRILPEDQALCEKIVRDLDLKLPYTG